MNKLSATIAVWVGLSQAGLVGSTRADAIDPASEPAPVVMTDVGLESSASPLLAGPPAFDLNWFTIDGGGAMYLTGDNFELGSTIGQHDAGRMSGGVNSEYVLVGGFWADAQELSCAGDANGDGRTDAADLSVLLGSFGGPVSPPGNLADFNASGLVEVGDLSVLLANFGCGV